MVLDIIISDSIRKCINLTSSWYSLFFSLNTDIKIDSNSPKMNFPKRL